MNAQDERAEPEFTALEIKAFCASTETLLKRIADSLERVERDLAKMANPLQPIPSEPILPGSDG